MRAEAAAAFAGAIPAADARDRRRRQRHLAADARRPGARRRGARARARRADRDAGRRGRAPPRARARAHAAAARRAYSCSTPPPTRCGGRCGSPAAGCAKASSSSWRRPEPWPRPPRSRSRRTSRTARAAARIVRVRARELFEQGDGRARHARHRARARHARRLAAAARGARDLRAVLPAAASSSGVLRDVKQLADALGERRDPDVHIDALTAFARQVAGRGDGPACAARRGAARAPGARQRGARGRAGAGRAARPARAAARARRRRRPGPGRPEPLKARTVTGLDPDGALADNAERIVLVRLDELCAFMPRAADPAEVVALHDMRIAAKRLRYILEVTAPCFGPYAEKATQAGQGPAGPARRDPRLRRADPRDRGVRRPAAGRGRRGAARRRRRRARPRPRAARAGAARARPRRASRRCSRTCARAASCCSTASSSCGTNYERKGFRARLEYAVAERAGDVHVSGQR